MYKNGLDLKIHNNSPDLLGSITVNKYLTTTEYYTNTIFYLMVLKSEDAKDTFIMATTITRLTM